jgi:carboxyl-terminal processing protease
MSSSRAPRPRLAVRALALVLALLIGIWLGGHPNVLPAALRGSFFQDRNTKLVDQVLNMLESQYYRPVSRTSLVNKGLTAMVASLNDPYSHYYDPASYRAFLNQSNPHLSGIGIDVMVESKGLRVVDVFANSPAAKAGIQRGDLIVAVGPTSLAGRTADFGSSLIRGKAGTSVALTIQRGHAHHEITVVRANVVIPVVDERMISYHGLKLGYVELTSFVQGAGSQVEDEVKKLLHNGAQGIIFDLRENGGGLLQEAVNVASVFIPDGTIVSTDGRSQPRQVYVARGGAVAPRIPLVVLVDRGTASAAEIVTGALHDRGRAKVVGTHTYGKGVFQEIEPLPNGGALDITVGEYFTPSGRNLGGGGVRQGAGIRPDIYALDNPHTGADEALQVAERSVAAKIR